MKRFIVVLLLMQIAACLLFGCSSKEDPLKDYLPENIEKLEDGTYRFYIEITPPSTEGESQTNIVIEEFYSYKLIVRGDSKDDIYMVFTENLNQSYEEIEKKWRQSVENSSIPENPYEELIYVFHE